MAFACRSRQGVAVVVAILAPLLHAFDSATVSDEDAVAQFPYLQRRPQCAGARSGSEFADFPSKVLHQIWWQGGEDLPAHFVSLRASWQKHHPVWQHKLWDRAAITALVNSEPYQWFAPTFHALPANIQRVDAARYIILHAEGGVYADVDIEALRSFDEVIDAEETRSSVQFFEEPATYWSAHAVILSNGLIAAPRAHPLMLRLLQRIKPVSEVFKSGGSHMLQAELQRCMADEEEMAGEKQSVLKAGSGTTKMAPCGCYVTKSSEQFFPLHDGLRRPGEFDHPRSHADTVEALADDTQSGRWPPAGAYSVQYYTSARICTLLRR